MMVETIILNYLSDRLAVRVCMEIPAENPPQRFVLIEKVGGGERDMIQTATLAIQSYAESMYQAATLNEQVKTAMRDAVTLDSISRCELNSDYNYTDTTKKKYRYQAVFDIVICGEE